MNVCQDGNASWSCTIINNSFEFYFQLWGSCVLEYTNHQWMLTVFLLFYGQQSRWLCCFQVSVCITFKPIARRCALGAWWCLLVLSCSLWWGNGMMWYLPAAIQLRLAIQQRGRTESETHHFFFANIFSYFFSSLPLLKVMDLFALSTEGRFHVHQALSRILPK